MGVFGWRNSLCAVGVAGILLTLLFVFSAKDAPSIANHDAHKHHPSVSFKDIVEVLKNKQNWLLTLYSGLAFSPIAVFGGLWGNPFLQQAYHLTKTQSASLLSLVFIGLGVGSPFIGILSNRFKDRRWMMFVFTLFAGISVFAIIYCHPMPNWLLSFFLFMFGFSLGAYLLVFTIGKEINKAYLTATVIAMINASDAILDAITEPAIGKLLDLGWNGKIVNGVHYFSLQSYHMALSVLPLYLLAAAVILFWVKDKNI